MKCNSFKQEETRKRRLKVIFDNANQKRHRTEKGKQFVTASIKSKFGNNKIHEKQKSKAQKVFTSISQGDVREKKSDAQPGKVGSHLDGTLMHGDSTILGSLQVDRVLGCRIQGENTNLVWHLSLKVDDDSPLDDPVLSENQTRLAENIHAYRRSTANESKNGDLTNSLSKATDDLGSDQDVVSAEQLEK